MTVLRLLALALLAATATASATGTASYVSIGKMSATLDFDYGKFADHKSIYGSAFARAVAKTIGAGAENVQVLSSQMGPTGVASTVVFYTVVAPANALTMQTVSTLLFGAGAPVGAAGLATFTNNIEAMGMTLTPTVHSGNSLPAPPPPLATFSTVSQGTQIAFDKNFADWQYSAYAYNAAVQSAIAEAVGVDTQDVWIYQNSLAEHGGTVVTFDLTSSNAISDTTDAYHVAHNTVTFAALFNHVCLDANGENSVNFNGVGGCICNNNSDEAKSLSFGGCNGAAPKPNYTIGPGSVINNGFATATYDRAGPKLLSLLQKYGLTFATDAYYYDQPTPAGR